MESVKNSKYNSKTELINISQYRELLLYSFWMESHILQINYFLLYICLKETFLHKCSSVQY